MLLQLFLAIFILSEGLFDQLLHGLETSFLVAAWAGTTLLLLLIFLLCLLGVQVLVYERSLIFSPEENFTHEEGLLSLLL